ncbi:hypothetical protein L2E82_49310 [Cichorium intybus]|uniref:Uncharacterized protein n=1 Tax=Cichorium intybus TaxID=13427 RepID=A0ACB8Z0F3_CICIN|nr:hypothetical protein L2E82_49310 [Cichorium intybus]
MFLFDNIYDFIFKFTFSEIEQGRGYSIWIQEEVSVQLDPVCLIATMKTWQKRPAEMTFRTTVTVACRRFRWISFPFSKAIGGHQKASSRGGGMSDEDEMALPG